MEGRREGIRDHDVVLVLPTLQSTPSGLLRAPKVSTFHPKRPWLSAEGLGNAKPSPDCVEPCRGEDGLSNPSTDANHGSPLVPNMLNGRLRVATCGELVGESTGWVLVRMNESY